jgi:hypothetical protein
MPKDIVLLTGAGFTRNYGGFLSSDMWEQFFNNPKMPDKLKSLMKKGSKGNDDFFNYEDIVQKVLVEDEYREHRDVLKEIVAGTYDRQEDKIETYLIGRQAMVGSLQEFIYTNVSLFFTLNQDTFIEKYLPQIGEHVLSMPYLTPEQIKYDKDITFRLPNEQELRAAAIPTLTNDRITNYIKLHGSRNWYDSQGKNFPVIGKNKREMIEKEPLLKKYFELFGTSLNTNKKLLIIGYSFMDKHINEIIKEGIRKGLKLFIVDAISSRQLRVNLMGTPANGAPVLFNVSESHKRILQEIWSGVSGYLKVNETEDLFGNKSESARERFPILFN